MKMKVHACLHTGHDIVWVDEAVFSAKTFRPYGFQPQINRLDYTPMKKKPDYIAAVIAISRHRGLILFDTKVKKAFTGQDFANFIKHVVEIVS